MLHPGHRRAGRPAGMRCSTCSHALASVGTQASGCAQVRQSKLQAIFVCIVPPSSEELERRLRSRATESEAQVMRRLKTAEAELARHAACTIC